jgi:hypothetical protein
VSRCSPCLDLTLLFIILANPRCPYAEGETFRLEVLTPDGSIYQLQALVLQTFSPFTISPVMKVKLENILPIKTVSPTATIRLPSEVIFKIYDRRFPYSLRKWYSVPNTNAESEAEYARYLAATPDPPKDEDAALKGDLSDPSLRAGFKEHLLAIILASYFESEVAVYDRLSSLQGIDIPVFYGTTKFLDGPLSPGVDLAVPGVLLEFIPGTNLELVDPTQVDINHLVNECLRIIASYDDLDIVNQDVRFENFILAPDGTSVTMIDFAQCRLRGENEDSEAWKKAKWYADEEGAVGVIAARKWGYKYNPTLRWVFLEDDDDENDENGVFIQIDPSKYL